MADEIDEGAKPELVEEMGLLEGHEIVKSPDPLSLLRVTDPTDDESASERP